MIDLQTISIVLASASVCVAAIYYAFTLRYTRMNMKNTLETRQAQLFMSVYQNHVSKENISDWIEMINLWEWGDYDEFVEKYDVPSSLENSSKYGSYMNRLEGLGVLVKRGLIDVNILYDLMYGSIIIIWEKFLPIIMENRRLYNAPHLYEDIENLYDEMVRIREERAHLTIISRREARET